MLAPNVLTALCSLPAVVLAMTPPQYTGFHGRWSDHFDGADGTLPTSTNWNVITTSQVYNDEYEVYTSKTTNVVVTQGRMRLIPQRDSTARLGWTSGRVESKYIFTPAVGKVTRLESYLRLASGAASTKKGIWPAFWLNGQSYRQGVKWPGCGEVDIFENINGDGLARNVVHCDVAPGGHCNEPIGLVSTSSIPDSNWHTWRVEFDRRNSTYTQQAIIWSRDGSEVYRVTGATVGDLTSWQTLCQAPLYVIFNVAVGGDFPGPPNSATLGGSTSMMEVGYVAHYEST